MKRILANVLKHTVEIDLVWKLVTLMAVVTRPLPGHTRCFQYLLYLRYQHSNTFIAQQADIACPDRRVASGPFEGLKYLKELTDKDALLPKLFGCYESELADALHDLLRNQYRQIHNVGCAEGYYAVGLALKQPTAQVVAYDISDRARHLCHAMAELNGVPDRLEIRTSCTEEHLLAIDRQQRHLILLDCEGYETELITEKVVSALERSDFLIEVHEHLGASLDQLQNVMSQHHDVQIIESLPDLTKALATTLPAFKKYPLAQRVVLLAELRRQRMSWLVAYSRQHGRSHGNDS